MVRITATASSEIVTSNRGFSSRAEREKRSKRRRASGGLSVTLSSSRAWISCSTCSTMTKKSASLDGKKR